MSAPVTVEQVVVDTPTPVLTYTTRTPSSAAYERDPLDSFFGYNFSASRTHESRHDEVLPAYVEDLPPTYTLKAPEPLTLARYLFMFGFSEYSPFRSAIISILTVVNLLVFPPFWIMGAWILWSPLRAPSDETDPEAWMPEKTEAERKHILEGMRRVEVRWALRCLWAIVILSFVAIGAGVGAWAIMRS
ncbi:hypothetical protein H0H81_002709 [Sphagnurus paluster]|uniref:Uncharacterized protein n=1 Tax=Sphagnurus paluster TaxID=117069 RepID=A0A9P7GMZ6_9AGAR|nr:hypothetical protein H0H81_002709 [Sphagnurus paluster]